MVKWSWVARVENSVWGSCVHWFRSQAPRLTWKKPYRTRNIKPLIMLMIYIFRVKLRTEKCLFTHMLQARLRSVRLEQLLLLGFHTNFVLNSKSLRSTFYLNLHKITSRDAIKKELLVVHLSLDVNTPHWQCSQLQIKKGQFVRGNVVLSSN